MIRVIREVEPRPDSLDKLYGDRVKPPKIKGMSELDSVLQRMLEHREKVKANKAKPLDFSFPFKRYSDSDVVQALRRLYHGKCAYCESRYAGFQPMDVEHWRPKGEVKENVRGSKPEPGYYWLASEWRNLLPSCIDCNRARIQFDALAKEEVVLGKKNQFPIDGSRTIKHEDDPNFDGGSEEALLINPCEEDPEELLMYGEKGLVLPKSSDPGSMEHRRAMASIRVYALNRSELVADRFAVIRMVDHRLRFIDKLADIRNALEAKSMPAEAEAVNDVIAAEIDVLLEMKNAERPHAGLARQLLRDIDRQSP